MKKTLPHKTAKLGDVIAAAFDEASRYSKDPKEVSRMATVAVRHLMHDAQRLVIPPLAAYAWA